VYFGDVSDRVASYGAHIALDTRANPAFPRNAIYARAAWRAISPEHAQRVNQYRLEGQGYLGLVKSSVLVVRAESETVDGALPSYERVMVGGFDSLRGFRAGSFVGDNRASATLELRVPLTSPMGYGQSGLAIFADAASAYDHGTRLTDAVFHYGYGAGWYLRAPLVQLDAAVGYGVGRGARVHVMAGLRF
jgi:outer membrane protein assembly factor BamA